MIEERKLQLDKDFLGMFYISDENVATNASSDYLGWDENYVLTIPAGKALSFRADSRKHLNDYAWFADLGPDYFYSLYVGECKGINEVRWLWKMTGLRKLNLTASGVSPFTTERIAKLVNLESLDLSSNSLIDNEALEALGALTNLRSLSLTGMIRNENNEWVHGQITDDGLSHLSGLTKLTHFGICGYPIIGQGLKHLSGMKELRELTLSNLLLEDEHLSILEAFPNLEELDIWSNKNLTDDCLKLVEKIKSLKKLSLGNSNLSNDAFKYLTELPNLEYINFEGSEVNLGVLRYIREMSALKTIHSTWGGSGDKDDLDTSIRNLDSPIFSATQVSKSALESDIQDLLQQRRDDHASIVRLAESQRKLPLGFGDPRLHEERSKAALDRAERVAKTVPSLWDMKVEVAKDTDLAATVIDEKYFLSNGVPLLPSFPSVVGVAFNRGGNNGIDNWNAHKCQKQLTARFVDAKTGKVKSQELVTPVLPQMARMVEIACCRGLGAWDEMWLMFEPHRTNHSQVPDKPLRAAIVLRLEDHWFEVCTWNYSPSSPVAPPVPKSPEKTQTICKDPNRVSDGELSLNKLTDLVSTAAKDLFQLANGIAGETEITLVPELTIDYRRPGYMHINAYTDRRRRAYIFDGTNPDQALPEDPALDRNAIHTRLIAMGKDLIQEIIDNSVDEIREIKVNFSGGQFVTQHGCLYHTGYRIDGEIKDGKLVYTNVYCNIGSGDKPYRQGVY